MNVNMERKWIVKEEGNPAEVRKLAQELNVDRVLANLLVKRGIKTFDQAKNFFRTDPYEGYGQGCRAFEQSHCNW